MFLATTPLTVKHGQGTVLLGPWCLEGVKEEHRELFRFVNHELVSLETKKMTNREVRETVDRLLPQLAQRLNALHGVNHGDRYWTIICGRWLLGFVDVLYQRWNLIETAFAQFPIERAGGSPVDHSSIAPRCSQDFASQRTSHDWNNQVFTAILEHKKVSVDLFPQRSSISVASVPDESQRIKALVLSLWGLVTRRSPMCIADSYFGKRSEFALALKNWSLPVRLTRAIPSKTTYSESSRIALRIPSTDASSFENFLFDNLHRWLPYSWVEDFMNLSTGPHMCRLPIKPHTIFTGNAHHSSDYFMMYMACHAERGSRIVLAQHGGLYGEGEVRSRNEEHELAIADTYVTWGWKDSKYNNIVNGPNQISRLTSTKCTSREGGLLIVLDTTFRYSRYSWETRPERDLYLESCAVLHSALPSAIQKKSVIRLHHDHNRYDEGHEKFFKESQEVAFDDFSRPIEKSIAVSRLVIVTTLSTTFIENVSRGIPTLIYAQPEIYEVRAEYREIFDELARVGVLHDSPVSAARWATSIWDGVEHWWNSEPVQVAVSLYGRHFAGFPSEERRTWQQILGGSSLKS